MVSFPTEKELEQVEGPEALAWVKAQNTLSAHTFESSPNFAKAQKDILQILESKEKIPYARKSGEYYYNFWQDEDHIRGLWRRTSFEEYQKEDPTWEIILDVDQLAREEGENWVFKGANRLMPDGDLCLVTLSKGGTDASYVREFNIDKKCFVADGFYLPEAKSRVAWLDKDRLLVGTDFGEDSLTDSGYPRIIKCLERNQSLDDAQILFAGERSDVSVGASSQVRTDGAYHFLSRATSFFESENYWLKIMPDKTFKLVNIPIPKTAELDEVFMGRALILLKDDWEIQNATYKAGSLISLALDSIESDELDIQSLFEPSDRMAIESMATTKSHIYVTVNHQVVTEIYQLQLEENHVNMTQVPIPENGSASIVSADNYSDDILLNYQNFLTPSTLYACSPEDLQLKAIKSAPHQFDASDLMVEQQMVASHDGTLVPYFLVHKKDIILDGTNPTLLYGYGGFEISLTPSYSATLGKTWLEDGGVYALANIRGGGEFGPAWHQAALKENRQRAYDDFESIARDLIAKNITSPKHLGIQGGSNGGLLVGVAFTQHPELYGAVLCQVPLLDMLKYHTLSAGASWVGEYGSPDDPKMRKVIEQYSPYHQVRENATYPEVFFMTSTKDDRVHPSHARKMVAKMQQMGHQVYYFETIEGGHGAAANLKQSAYNKALTTMYFKDKLMKPSLELLEDFSALAASTPPPIRLTQLKSQEPEPSLESLTTSSTKQAMKRA